MQAIRMRAQPCRYLEKLQDQHDELEEKFEEELRELESKYRALYGGHIREAL